MQFVTCKHYAAQPPGTVGKCAMGVLGGVVTRGVCLTCEKYDGPPRTAEAVGMTIRGIQHATNPAAMRPKGKGCKTCGAKAAAKRAVRPIPKQGMVTRWAGLHWLGYPAPKRWAKRLAYHIGLISDDPVPMNGWAACGCCVELKRLVARFHARRVAFIQWVEL